MILVSTLSTLTVNIDNISPDISQYYIRSF